MVYSLMHLNPEGAAAIVETLEDSAGVSSFLENLSAFLNTVGSSVASQDLAFCTAAELSATGVWAHIPLKVLAPVLLTKNTTASAAFQRGLPSDLRNRIADHHVVEAFVREWSPRIGGEPISLMPSDPSLKKKIAGDFRLRLRVGEVNPSIPFGRVFRQRGLDFEEFCKAFNAATQEMEKDLPVSVDIAYFQDKSFTFRMKQPPVSYFLKKEAKTKAGTKAPRKGAKAASITKAQVRSIAKAKMEELHEQTLEGAIGAVMQEASTLGIKIVN